MLAIAWAVIYPVVVLERRGMGAFGRSADLTRGHRWPIFGLVLIYMVIAMLAGGAGSVIALIAGGQQSLIGGFIVSVFQTAAILVGIAGSSALYVELRNAKDGFASQTADVFA